MGRKTGLMTMEYKDRHTENIKITCEGSGI